MLHSCLCFLLGLFAGLAPSDWTDAASRAAATANAAATKQVFRALHAVRAINNISTTTTPHHHFGMHGYQYQRQQQDPQVLVVVTTTRGVSTERERRSAGLTRTAHALRLVSPPVVWLVVEAARDAADTALLLRRTGVVYRHVTYKENFSSSAAEEERQHQRSVAMGHIEQHRMRGVVLFAGLGDVYDLRLLEQLRRVRYVQ
jgi:putative beta-1,4-xylosyltransferase IRX9